MAKKRVSKRAVMGEWIAYLKSLVKEPAEIITAGSTNVNAYAALSILDELMTLNANMNVMRALLEKMLHHMESQQEVQDEIHGE